MSNQRFVSLMINYQYPPVGMQDNSNRFDRRTVLSTMGAAGLTGITGCLNESSESDGQDGSSESDGQTLRMHTASESTGAYAMSQGMAAVVNENTDNVRLEGLSSQGSEANVGLLNRGESEMAYIDDSLYRKIQNNEEPFNDLDFDPVQLFFFYDLATFFITTSDDIVTVYDIDSDTSVSPNIAGSTNRTTLLSALEIVGVTDFTLENIAQGEQASAFNEGRLDVGYLQPIAGELPSWAQEIISTVDTKIVEFPDDAVSALEDSDIVTNMFNSDEVSEDLARAPEEILGIVAPYIQISRGDIDYDLMYEFLETMHENRDALGQYHDLLTFFEDEEYWVKEVFPDMPFHPAAADFYQEIGIWNDDWTKYEQ